MAKLGRVLALLEAVRGGTAGALMVEGEAGIGKTTLLHAAEELAGGFACLWARGVESEAALGHAALLELLTRCGTGRPTCREPRPRPWRRRWLER